MGAQHLSATMMMRTTIIYIDFHKIYFCNIVKMKIVIIYNSFYFLSPCPVDWRMFASFVQMPKELGLVLEAFLVRSTSAFLSVLNTLMLRMGGPLGEQTEFKLDASWKP